MNNADNISYTIKGLTKGKIYNIYVRSFKVLGKKKYYSAWSKSESIKAGMEDVYWVEVPTGYLALRTAPSYDERNEIGPLWPESKVQVLGPRKGKYTWVKVISTASGLYGRNLNGKTGYVNASYLKK